MNIFGFLYIFFCLFISRKKIKSGTLDIVKFDEKDEKLTLVDSISTNALLQAKFIPSNSNRILTIDHTNKLECYGFDKTKLKISKHSEIELSPNSTNNCGLSIDICEELPNK